MAYQLGKFKYHSTYSGDEGLVMRYQEGATQSFKRGDLVVLSSGKIVIETSPAATNILGFALQDATGVTDSLIDVQVIRPGDVFIVPFQSDDTFAVANVGVAYDFVRNATTATWEINTDSTGTASVVVLDTPEVSATGLRAPTAGGPAFVYFQTADLAFGT